MILIFQKRLVASMTQQRCAQKTLTDRLNIIRNDVEYCKVLSYNKAIKQERASVNLLLENQIETDFKQRLKSI